MSAQARNMLEELILSGALAVGEKITERDIAAQLGMSRAPVREAIKESIAAGLLEQASARSIVVRDLKFSELEEIYTIRMMLEARAARLAAQKIDLSTMEALDSLHERMATAASKHNFKTYYDLNIEFHQLIHKAADAPRLIGLIDMIMKESLLFRSRGLVDQTNIEISMKEHAAILEALRSKDSELAEIFMSRHIRGGLERLRL